MEEAVGSECREVVPAAAIHAPFRGPLAIPLAVARTFNILGRAPDHGFDQPLGLLADCHRRIETFLGILLRIAHERHGQPLDPAAIEAVGRAKRYFAEAAPRHTADEEESLFPRIRAALGEQSESRAALDRLRHEHETADRLHARADSLLAIWLRDGRLSGEDAAELTSALEQLQQLYQGHIEAEETVVFPLAARVLSGETLGLVGAEMRARRGLSEKK
jgi:hemerythrin-like domain-containing protein